MRINRLHIINYGSETSRSTFTLDKRGQRRYKQILSIYRTLPKSERVNCREAEIEIILRREERVFASLTAISALILGSGYELELVLGGPRRQVSSNARVEIFYEKAQTDEPALEYFNRGELFLKLVKKIVRQEDFDMVFEPMVAEFEHQYLEIMLAGQTEMADALKRSFYLEAIKTTVLWTLQNIIDGIR